MKYIYIFFFQIPNKSKKKKNLAFPKRVIIAVYIFLNNLILSEFDINF